MLWVNHLIADLAAFVADRWHTVTRDEYAERLRICQLCRKRVGRRCFGGKDPCGCIVAIRAKGRVWECPENRWPPISVADE